MTHITDEAVEAAAKFFAERRSQAWLTFSDEIRSGLIASWKPMMRAALEAALPHLEGATPSRYRLAWLSARRRARFASKAFFAEAAAARELEGATPAIDRGAVREEIRAGLNSALCNGGFPETGWSPSAEVDRITDAIMALIGGTS